MTEARRALIAVGSNIEPGHHIPAGITALERAEAVTLLAVSATYETAPLGNVADPWFHNSVLLVSTTLDPAGLRELLRTVEAGQGRERNKDRNAPRTLDLDLAAYEGFAGDVGGTPVPDPELGLLPHLAVPAAEVAPDWVLPDGSTLADAAAEIDPDPTVIRRLAVSGGSADSSAADRVRGLLGDLGIDPATAGLEDTPELVAEAFGFLTSGYGQTIEEVVAGAIFDSDADEMVVVRGIEFYSLCEHHLLPFFGKADVAYLPNGRLIGLGRVAAVVDLFARRLQLQEHLTNEIADALVAALDPKGVAVILEASHLCMMMRGVQRPGSTLVTSAMRGIIKSDARTRGEFLAIRGD
jgi:GTP cyclohydrolase I